MKTRSDIRVSVLIPVYNGECFLSTCLESVVGQTLRELEVVCVNDGSTDGTARLVDAWTQKDGRVRAIHSVHSGSAAAKNLALSMARGEFVAFMDADDLYADSNVLKELYEGAVSSDCPIAGGNLMSFDECPGDCARGISFGPGISGFVGRTAYRNYAVPFGYTCYIYRRSLLDAWDIRFPLLTRYEDPIFFVRAMCASKYFESVNRTVYLYRKPGKSVDWSADGYLRRKDHVNGLRMMTDLASEYSLPPLIGFVLSDLKSVLADADAAVAVAEEFAVLLHSLRRCPFVDGKAMREVVRAAFHQTSWLRRMSLLVRLFGPLAVIWPIR